MKTVAECWQEFQSMCVPRDASTVQRLALRDAFYAGFIEAMHAGTKIAEATGRDAAAGAALYRALNEECTAFAFAKMTGRA